MIGKYDTNKLLERISSQQLEAVKASLKAEKAPEAELLLCVDIIGNDELEVKNQLIFFVGVGGAEEHLVFLQDGRDDMNMWEKMLWLVRHNTNPRMTRDPNVNIRYIGILPSGEVIR